MAEPSSAAPDLSVSVVIPTLEAGPRLRECIESLGPLGADREVVIVDNGSADEGLAELEELDGVRVLAMGKNTGFSFAVNRGAEAARGDALVVLNDDCICEPGFLDAIAAPLDPGAGVVMVASLLLDPHDPRLIEAAGMVLDRTLSVFNHLDGRPLGVLGSLAAEPVGPSAAAAAFDRRAFLEAGGFDERIFAYGEDVDLVLRLREQGGRCVLAPEARATHQLSATLGVGSARKNRLMGYGRGYVMRKWGAASLARLPAVALCELVVCAGQLLIDRNAAGIRGRIDGWRAIRREREYPRAALHAQEPGSLSVTRQLWRRYRKRFRLLRAR